METVLNLSWTFGVNRDILGGVHNLSDGNYRKVLFYSSSHTGVLYDWTNGRQQLLQGHCNQITTTAITSDKRWIVTADRGTNPLLIVWDTMPHLAHHPAPTSGRDQTPTSGAPGGGGGLGGLPMMTPGFQTINALPIKTLFDIHDGAGVVAAEFSVDSRYLVTLGNEKKQTIAIWDWTTESEKPIASFIIEGEPQKCIKINPEDPCEMITNGNLSVSFFIWDMAANTLQQNVPRLSSKDFKHTPTAFTYSIFIPTTNQSVTATADGDIVVWTDRSLNNLSVPLERGKKAAIKFMRLHNGSINFLTTINKKYVITGGDDGFVKIFDMQFRLILWFERLKSGPISSISFSNLAWQSRESIESIVEGYDIPEFIIVTKQSKVLLMSRATQDFKFDQNTREPDDKRPHAPKGTVSMENDGEPSHSQTGSPVVKVLVEAQYDTIHGLIAHPSLPQFAVGGHSGVIQIWDYSTKKLVCSRQFDDNDSVEDNSETSEDAGMMTFNFGESFGFGKSDESSDPMHSSISVLEKKQNVKKGVKESSHEVQKVESMSFSRDGKLLAVGFADGTARILQTRDLSDHDGPRNPQGIKLAQFWNISSGKPILITAFSPCGSYLAFADAGFAVSLLKKELKVGPKKEVQGHGEAVERLAAGTLSVQWVLVGRCQAHYKEIISLIFVPTSGETQTLTLVSVSKDRHVAEYDLQASTIVGGIKVKSLKRIEQSAVPLAASLYPKVSESTGKSEAPSDSQQSQAVAEAQRQQSGDSFLLIANSEYKLKLNNATTQLCRKTVLGPTYGGHLTGLRVIPDPDGQAPKYVAYMTADRVVGLIKMPLDGNPHRSMGLISHPCKISSIAISYDGAYMFSAGIEDGVVNMWGIQPNALEAQIQLGGKGIEPFLNMLDPTGAGADGAVYREMEDYFYYAQLRSQGEDVTNARLIQDTVDIAEVPSIMQAMGFYPTGQEIEDIINEVKFSKIDDGELVDSITFADLIKLYVNHRPVFDFTEGDLFAALSEATRQEPGKSVQKVQHPDLKENDLVKKEGLLALLQQYGETMSKADFEMAFKALLINDANYAGNLPDNFSPREFVENILGLQPVPPGGPTSADGPAATAIAGKRTGSIDK